MRISLLTIATVVLGLTAGWAPAHGAEPAKLPQATELAQNTDEPQIGLAADAKAPSGPALTPSATDAPAEPAPAEAAPAAPAPPKPWSMPEPCMLKEMGIPAVWLAGTGSDLQLAQPHQSLERAGHLQRPQQRV